MMNNSSDSCSRQVSQLHKELRVSRQEGLSLQGQLDTSLGHLQRKREKKRHYKVALLQETEQLQAALLHKDVRIAELNHRIDKVRGKARYIHKSRCPLTGQGLIASTGFVIYAGNHRGVPCTIGLSRLNH